MSWLITCKMAKVNEMNNKKFLIFLISKSLRWRKMFFLISIQLMLSWILISSWSLILIPQIPVCLLKRVSIVRTKDQINVPKIQSSASQMPIKLCSEEIVLGLGNCESGPIQPILKVKYFEWMINIFLLCFVT